MTDDAASPTAADAAALLKAELADLAGPLLAIKTPEDARLFLSAVGWNASALPGFDLVALASDLAAAAPEVLDALNTTDTSLPGLAAAAVRLSKPVGAVVERVRGWQPPATITPAHVGTLIEDIVHGLFDAYLFRRQPVLRGALALTGIIDVTDHPAVVVGGVTLRRAQPRPRFDLPAIRDALTDPLGYLRTQLTAPGQGRRTAEGLSDIVGPILQELLSDLEIPVTYGPPGLEQTNLTPERLAAAQRLLVIDWVLPILLEGQPLATRYRAVFGLVDDTGGKGLGLVVATTGPAAIGFSRPELSASLAVEGLPKSVLITGAGVTLPAGATGSPALSIDITLPGNGPGPAFRLGDPNGTALTVERILVALRFDTANGPDVSGRLALSQVRLNLAGGDGDGFLSKVLPPGDAGGGNIELRWSLRRGLALNASGELEWQLDAMPRAGPLEIRGFKLRFRLGTDGVSFVAGALIILRLGPVSLTAEDVGLTLGLAGRTSATTTSLVPIAAPGAHLDLGPARLEAAFKLPSGIGISIDAGPVKGGGYLFSDPAKGEYAGAISLEFQGIKLQAVGLLTTRLPGGRSGFSLLVVITARFQPIELGFGFSLTGVGGLIGVNRTFGLDALRAGLKTKALESILFSRDDPVPRAAQIVATLDTVFPAAADRFVVGPMAQITWGTPVVVTIEIALLVELPAPVRIVVLGRLRALFPPGAKEADALVRLNLDVLGIIDFDRREASVDAVLYDSVLMGFAITGEMALRASWGERPTFALAIGGLHPRFERPPGLPALKRVVLHLAQGDDARIRLDAYLAITANTVQFGANLDAVVRVAEFTLELQLGFDALVQLSPFRFVADLAGRMAIKQGSTTLLTAAVTINLSGPAPWHVRLRATFELLGFKQSIEIESTFGDAVAPVAPAVVDVRGDLINALNDVRNWKADAAVNVSHPVVTRAADRREGDVLAHPMALLSVEQRAVPLGRAIDRVGAARPTADRYFGLTTIDVDATAVATEPISAYFSPAQYWDMTDAEKLAAPSFDRFAAGVRIRPPSPRHGAPVEATVVYDTVIVGPDRQRVSAQPASYAMAAPIAAAVAENGAAAQAPARNSGSLKYRHRRLGVNVGVADTTYVVASKDDLRELEGAAATGGNYRGAVEALRRRAAARPAEKDRLVIVPAREAVR